MDARNVPARELIALGRIETVCVMILLHGRPLGGLVDRMAMADEGWRTDVLSRLRPIQDAVDHGKRVEHLAATPSWGSLVAALDKIGATVSMAEHVLGVGNVPSFTLLVKHRLPQATVELAKALDMLTGAVLARHAPGVPGFAC